MVKYKTINNFNIKIYNKIFKPLLRIKLKQFPPFFSKIKICRSSTSQVNKNTYLVTNKTFIIIKNIYFKVSKTILEFVLNPF